MLAALIIVAAYLRQLALGQTFVLRDQLTWALPSRSYLHAALAHGRLPEWWDAVGLGTPYAANPLYGVTYPPTWIVALVPAAWGSDFLFVVHLAWLALGTSLLARRLGADARGGVVAGVAAALSGFASSTVVDGLVVLMLAWTPWILWGADRLALAVDGRARLRAALVLAALWAAQLFAGIPGVIDTAVIAGLWTLIRAERKLPAVAWLAGSVVAALPLAAVALLPAAHLWRTSERASGISLDDATVWSLHPRRLAELVWPRAADVLPPDESAGQPLDRIWAFSVYLGAPVAIFAGYAIARGEKHARALGLVALLFVVLALGRYTPLYALYRTIVVPERVVRYPEKHLGGVVVLVAALAGVGFSRAFAGAAAKRLGLAFGAATLAFAVGHALGAALACLVVGAALWRRWASLALAAIALHLAVHGWTIQPLVPRAAVTRVPALLEPIAAHVAPPRPRIYRLPNLNPRSTATTIAAQTVAQRDTGLENGAAPYGFAHVPGFEAALDPRWHAVWDAGVPTGARLLERFDVQYAILPAPLAARSGFTPRAALGGAVLVENLHRRPRAFVAHKWRFTNDDAEARAALFSPAHEGELQLAGTGAPSPPGASPTPTPCALDEHDPERVVLRCHAAAAGWAVLLDSVHAGWSATVDGTPTPITRAEVVTRAVPVAAGDHVIVFRYVTPGLRGGFAVSLVAWLAWALALVVTRRPTAAARSPRASGPPPPRRGATR